MSNTSPENPQSNVRQYQVRLPQTDFPMRANLPVREKEILSQWQATNLWQKLRDQAEKEGRKKYILHDGPPYANGHLHIGHAVNKILKDVISRAWQARGYDANYVPGWDCHGLPIEWKVEENFRANNKDKQDIPINDFRNECKKFAEKWVDIQREEFKRLGILADWDNPYLTMKHSADAAIARNIGHFLMDGSLYKGTRPVMWSPVERTALAEAEVEYKEHKSPALFVKFPIVAVLGDGGKNSSSYLLGASIVIWTTTPWTIPGNRAVAYSKDLTYHLLQIDDEDSPHKNARIILAENLIDNFKQKSGLQNLTFIGKLSGADFAPIICKHPLALQDADYANINVRVFAADFVTDAQGTGFVHIGPANGTDDYQLALKHGLPIPDQIADDSAFRGNVPLFAGCRILNDDGTDGDANGKVIDALKEAGSRIRDNGNANGEEIREPLNVNNLDDEVMATLKNENNLNDEVIAKLIDELSKAGALLAKHSYRHSYPHSWRSKAPVIYRNTAQWFISMEKNNLRDKALKALENVNFHPKAGKARLTDMIAKRPDWCISRQRAWGVPLPIFVRKADGEMLRDADVMNRIADAFEQEGSDCWFSAPKSRFLGDKYDPADYEQVQDVVDVWFDSGSTHSFVLDARADLQFPADLYLEGTDQHRGWFHSSLLVSAGVKNIAPYKNVLTHGFALDKDGRKMSKSMGNGMVPEDVVQKYGADILRLWVVNADYTEDTRIGDEILKRIVDNYRRIRNSLRFMLGNLPDNKRPIPIPYQQLPELERYVLHRVSVLDKELTQAIDDYDYTSYSHSLYHFCHFLSFIYFDIRKDCLYCDAPDSPKYRATIYLLDVLFNFVASRASIILSFTAEEAWQTRYGADESVCLSGFSKTEENWYNSGLAKKWERALLWRGEINRANEEARNQKQIRSSLEAQPNLMLSESDNAIATGFSREDLAEIMITAPFAPICQSDDDADAENLPRAIAPNIAQGDKCGRCWRVLPDIKNDLCERCHLAEKTLAEKHQAEKKLG